MILHGNVEIFQQKYQKNTQKFTKLTHFVLFHFTSECSSFKRRAFSLLFWTIMATSNVTLSHAGNRQYLEIYWYVLESIDARRYITMSVNNDDCLFERESYINAIINESVRRLKKKHSYTEVKLRNKKNVSSNSKITVWENCWIYTISNGHSL